MGRKHSQPRPDDQAALRLALEAAQLARYTLTGALLATSKVIQAHAALLPAETVNLVADVVTASIAVGRAADNIIALYQQQAALRRLEALAVPGSQVRQ